MQNKFVFLFYSFRAQPFLNIVFIAMSISGRLKRFFFLSVDLVPAVQIDFDAVAEYPCEEGKTIFTSDQKAALEAKFRRKKYPTRQEKAELALKLGIGFCIVQVCLEQLVFNSRSFIFVRICFLKILRLKFATFQECFKNKPEATILKGIIFC